jgi:hypothetical protein
MVTYACLTVLEVVVEPGDKRTVETEQDAAFAQRVLDLSGLDNALLGQHLARHELVCLEALDQDHTPKRAGA